MFWIDLFLYFCIFILLIASMTKTDILGILKRRKKQVLRPPPKQVYERNNRDIQSQIAESQYNQEL